MKTREEQIAELAEKLYWEAQPLLPIPLPWKFLPPPKKQMMIRVVTLLADGIQSLPRADE